MAIEMHTLKARLFFTEEILGTASNNPEIHSEYIASKAEDAMKIEEEVAAIGVEEVIEKSMTVFPRNETGAPILWDYQGQQDQGLQEGDRRSSVRLPPNDPPEHAHRAGRLRTSPQSSHRPG